MRLKSSMFNIVWIKVHQLFVWERVEDIAIHHENMPI